MGSHTVVIGVQRPKSITELAMRADIAEPGRGLGLTARVVDTLPK